MTPTYHVEVLGGAYRTNGSAPAPRRVLLVDSYGGEVKGGSSAVLRDILHGVDRRRFVPVLACLRDGPWPQELRQQGELAFAVPRRRYRSVGNVVSVVRGLVRLVREEDVSLIHASEASSFLYASLAGRLSGTPVVWHVHSPYAPGSISEKMIASMLARLRPSYAIFTSDGARGRSPALAGIPGSVVHPGADLERCRSGDRAQGRRLLGIPEDATVVSMFARFGAMKGQMEFVRCFASLAGDHPELYGVMCGIRRPHSAYGRRVQSALDALGLGDRLLTPGYVASPEKDDVVAASDLVVHPSRAESFGLAVLEAMAAGRPVVATNTEGPSMLIEDGVNGMLVPVDDVRALTAALQRLLEDPVLRSRLGASASLQAEEYTLERMVEGVEEVWGLVLGSGGLVTSSTGADVDER